MGFTIIQYVVMFDYLGRGDYDYVTILYKNISKKKYIFMKFWGQQLFMIT